MIKNHITIVWDSVTIKSRNIKKKYMNKSTTVAAFYQYSLNYINMSTIVLFKMEYNLTLDNILL